MKHLLFIPLMLNIMFSTSQNLTTSELESEDTKSFIKYIIDNESFIYGDIIKVNSEWVITANNDLDISSFILKKPKRIFKAKTSKKLIEKIIKKLTNDNRENLKYEYFIEQKNDKYFGYFFNE